MCFITLCQDRAQLNEYGEEEPDDIFADYYEHYVEPRDYKLFKPIMHHFQNQLVKYSNTLMQTTEEENEYFEMISAIDQILCSDKPQNRIAVQDFIDFAHIDELLQNSIERFTLNNRKLQMLDLRNDADAVYDSFQISKCL